MQMGNEPTLLLEDIEEWERESACERAHRQVFEDNKALLLMLLLVLAASAFLGASVWSLCHTVETFLALLA